MLYWNAGARKPVRPSSLPTQIAGQLRAGGHSQDLLEKGLPQAVELQLMPCGWPNFKKAFDLQQHRVGGGHRNDEHLGCYLLCSHVNLVLGEHLGKGSMHGRRV